MGESSWASTCGARPSDWPSFLAAGRRAEELGYDHLWTWDHIYAIFGDPYQPIFEGYTALAALAQATERIRLGLFVGANTFRNPGLAVKAVTTSTTSAAGGRSSASAGRGSSSSTMPSGSTSASGFGQRLDWLAEAVVGDADAARRRRGDEPAGRPLRVRPTAHRAASRPGPPADHDRRRGREEDAPDRRRATPTCGTSSARPRRSPTRTRSCGRTAPTVGRDTAEIERTLGFKPTIRSTDAEAERASGSTSSSTTGRRPRGWRATCRSGRARRSRSPRRCRLRRVGFHTFIAELPAPYDAETMESLATVVRPMVDAAMTA